MTSRGTTILMAVLVGWLLIGCATNPVTGLQELQLVSESQEIQLGSENYLPTRQMQGGDYSLDASLTAYVNTVGQRLAKVADRPLPYEFAIVNDSTPNAWALPGGKIAVNRGLLVELQNEAELAAVLSHEIVHAAARHSAQQMERSLLLQGAVAATGIAMRNNEYARLATGSAMVGAALITHRYSREAEREADTYGMIYMARAGYDAQAAVTLQEKFVRLSEGRQRNWLEGLFASHPPSRERVAANHVTARKLGPGGELGTVRYQSHIAHLKATQPAYDLYDRGRKALAAGDSTTALRLAREALAIEPREALFYAMAGDAHYTQRRYPQALEAYDRAVARNPDFFHFYLQRGLTRAKLGDRSGARQDLERSIRLLPTATAYNALGNSARSRGDDRQATAFFREAAGANCTAATQASESLARLDLPRNPNRYISVYPEVDSTGYLTALLTNRAALTVTDVQLVVHYPGITGTPRQRQHQVKGPIEPNRSVRIGLGLGPIEDAEELAAFRLDVVGARISP